MATAEKTTTKKAMAKKKPLTIHERLLVAKFPGTTLSYTKYINRKVWKYGPNGVYGQYDPNEKEKKENASRFIGDLFRMFALTHTCSMYEIGYVNKYFIQNNTELFLDMVRNWMKASPRRKVCIMNVRFQFKTKDAGVMRIGSYIGNHGDGVYTYIINKTKTKLKQSDVAR